MFPKFEGFKCEVREMSGKGKKVIKNAIIRENIRRYDNDRY